MAEGKTPVEATREARLRERVRHGLAAEHVELADESGRHVGHPGAAGGAGYYHVVVVSPRFVGLDRVARHRLVYEAVGDLIPDEVHALAISAYAPDEWRARKA
ncbi:MAG: BolA family transcriptional regulator [Deltaproteobacteria bacterium]|nr:BolA family transcriptional regulator [Deltaproteobacteria bacterium]